MFSPIQRATCLCAAFCLCLGVFLTACGDATATPNATGNSATATPSDSATTTQIADSVAATVNAGGSPPTRAARGTDVAALPTVAPNNQPTIINAPNITVVVPPTTAPVPDAVTTAPAAIVTTAPVVITTAPPSADLAKAIEKTDWPKVVKADPKLKVTTTYDGKPFVSVKDTKGLGISGDSLGGIPGYDRMIYIDLDGDGVEDAVMPLASGGTAGDIGYLVFQISALAPSFVTARDGYKVYVKNDGGKLVVQQPIYTGFEGNCCPSGLAKETYILKDGKLVSVAHSSSGVPEAQPDVVKYYYQLLNDKKFEQAFKLLSDAQQKILTLDNLKNGNKNTVSVSADTSLKEPGTVLVTIVSKDKENGKSVDRKFTGTWKIEWSQARDGWILSNPQIKAA